MELRTPAEVFPPGEFIRDELEVRGWTQADLAEIMGCPLRTINEIIAGKKSITPETAIGLSQAFDTSAELWLNLENAYRLSSIAGKSEDVARKARLYDYAPIGEMIKRGWLESTVSVQELEKQVLAFFETSSLDEKPAARFAARKSTSYDEETPAPRAWFCRAKKLARRVQAGSYRKDQIDVMIAALRLLTTSEQEIRRLPQLLADFGIRLVFLEHLSKTKIDGVAFWLDEQSPVIALSLRYDRIDWFWHTLGHEIGHIKNGDALSLDNDLEGAAPAREEERPESERKADEIAADLLVPKQEIEAFIQRVRPLYSTKKLFNFLIASVSIRAWSLGNFSAEAKSNTRRIAIGW